MAVFRPRERKHKVRRRTSQESSTSFDTNHEVIHPENQRELREKHEVLQARLRSEQPKMSSKKKKRLDKYIDTKLRKEENLQLLKRLAKNKVDTSIFQSSKNLGTGKDSKRSLMTQALKRQRAGISTPADQNLLYEHTQASDVDEKHELSSDDSQTVYSKSPEEPTLQTPARLQAGMGNGLKRPLQRDARGDPIIKKRVRLKTSQPANELDNEIPWEGFSSTSDLESNSDVEFPSNLISATETSSEGEYEDDGCAALSMVGVRRPEHNNAFIPAREKSGFKEWAMEQMNEARDFKPSLSVSNIHSLRDASITEHVKLREPDNDPLPPELQIPKDPVQRHAYSVSIERSADIQESRLKLPIVSEEQKIMEAIHNNPIVIICGATGSGKTTQVPQFLLEAGYGSPEGPTPGMIGVTQPRRVAAVTMSRRVAQELGNASDKVSYQVRFDSNTSRKTAIKFMTDGILVREIVSDVTLKKYSAIIIDEAHERSVNTDILIGMLSRIVDLRSKLSREDSGVKPLKVIIMSATLMVEAFAKNERLFRNGFPPLVQSEGRQHNVTMHFARKTQRDYVEEMFKKVIRGHRKLPPGGMLIFLTGQGEVNNLAKRLHQKLNTEQQYTAGQNARIAPSEAPLELEDWDMEGPKNDESDESIYGEETDEEDPREFDIGGEEESKSLQVLILPLYSQLPTKEQLRVFEPPPDNTRLIILATNVAETSITIPGIRYVFDCGRVKERTYDKRTGVQAFDIGWVSKASATQRAGRAGRTGPGHCYRLYSSAVYERDFSEHTIPEILRVPIEGVVLQLKSMHLENVVNFPFPTAPESQDIARAEDLLTYLGALDRERKITSLGKEISFYPLSPRHARMLSLGHQHECIYLITATIAALAVPEIFIPKQQIDKAKARQNNTSTYAQNVEDSSGDELDRIYNKAHRTLSSRDSKSDAIKLLAAFCVYASKQAQGPSSDALEFCKAHFIRPKALQEAFRLYQQLLSLKARVNPGSVDPDLVDIAPPSDAQLSAIKQITAAGFIDQVAIRADLAPVAPEVTRKPRGATDVPYLTLFPSQEGRTLALDASPSAKLDATAVFIHPSSVLAQCAPASLPRYLVYSHLQRGAAPYVVSSNIPRTRMHPLTPVTAEQLFRLAAGTPLVEYGKPIGRIESLEGEPWKREFWAVPSLVGGPRGGCWPLPAVKLKQVKNQSGHWVTERVIGSLKK